MTLSTALSRRLQLGTPIFQAPMAGVTSPELVAAVGQAGALGGFGFAYTEPAAMQAAVEKTRAIANVPIHINLFVEAVPIEPDAATLRAAAKAIAPAFEALGLTPPDRLAAPFCPDLFAQIETAIALRPTMLSSHFNVFAPEVIRAARAQGIVIACSATTLEEARALEAAGVDVIIAQGSEAGGHRGTFSGARETGMIGTIALTRLIVKHCRVPVVAAGGIMDGAGVAAALALGAQAAQIGTAFIPTPQSVAPVAHKQAIMTLGANGTAITRAFSGRPARGIRNRYIELTEQHGGPILPFPVQNKMTVPLRAESAKRGSPDYYSLWAGQAYELARELDAATLVRTITREAEETIESLKAL
jgi:nitronate monooxygenase